MSRKSWLYWIRSIFALAGIAAALFMFYEGARSRMAPGEPMLWLLSAVTMALALFSGSLLTADCISSEKRDDTLGLLFLTNLKGYDVVTGKVAIHAITTTCGLLSLFPVFFLPILAGGVTWGETLRVLLGIGVSFLFALTLGVWISTRSRDARNAVMVTLTIILLVVVLPLLWLALLDALRVRPVSLVGIPQLSPAMLLFFARDSWYVRSSGSVAYWTSISLFVIASMTFAVLASFYLPKVWRSEGLNLSTDGHKSIWRFVPRRKARGGKLRRRLRITFPNPLQNLFLSRFKEFVWGTRFRRLLVIFFWAMLLFSFFDGDDEAFVFAFLTVLGMHTMTKFVFAFDATRALSEDKRSSALELLLITPLGERAIAEGQAAAFAIQFRKHVRLLFGLTLALQFTAIVNDELRLRGDDLFLLSSFMWGPMIWTWSDYRSIAWVGMHHALKQSTQLKAMLRTLGGIMLVPWMPYFFVLLCMAESNADEEAAGLVTFAWAIGAAIYQKFRTVSRRAHLLRDFGILATGSPSGRSESGIPSDSYPLFPKGSGAARMMDWVSGLASKP